MKHNVSTLPLLKQTAKWLLPRLQQGDLVFLIGDLGMGKTTFTQMLLHSAGVQESVKSPTYTLFESYQSKQLSFIHMDLYRLSHPEELYYLGIEDILNNDSIVLIEWPEKGQGVLPIPQWSLSFTGNNLNRSLTITSK